MSLEWPSFVPAMLARRRADGFGATRGGAGAAFVPWSEVLGWLQREGLAGVALPTAEGSSAKRARAGLSTAAIEGPTVGAALSHWLADDVIGGRVAEGASRLGLGLAATQALAILATAQRWPTLGLLWRKLAGDPVVDGLTPLGVAALVEDSQGACLAALLPGGELDRLGVLSFDGRPNDARRVVSLAPALVALLFGGQAVAADVFVDAATSGKYVPAALDGPAPRRFATRREAAAVADDLASARTTFIRGPDARVRRDTGLAAAQLLRRPVLFASGANRTEDTARALLGVAGWAAPLLDAVVVVDGVDTWIEALADELRALTERENISFVFGHVGDVPGVHGALVGATHHTVKAASAKMRATLVADLIGTDGPAATAMGPVLRDFALDLDATAAVARDLQAREVVLLPGENLAPGLVAESLRMHLGSRVTDIAEHIPTRGGLRELEMTAEARVSLESIVVAWTRQQTLLDTWGFGRRMGGAASLSALFFGPPGTGKTLAASMLAHELGLQLFRVDLSQVVDKYIGETEKQLEKVFTEAERSQVVLLFDEADSLFGARTDVKKASDRYSNMQVSFLLQRIEVHRGIVILTTNHEASLDQAFRRRIRYSVSFPMPTIDERSSLWRRLIPAATPVDDVVRFDELGEDFVLSGGHIRNAVLRAAFAAATAGRGLVHDDLVMAANAEYRSLGHVVRSRNDS